MPIREAQPRMDCYRDAITYLFGLRRFGIRPGLGSITRLLECLGSPERGLRIVHIAGTNGKGSTAAFLHAILCRCGYRCGLYTSPHLADYCERIRTGPDLIGQECVLEHTWSIRRACDMHHLAPCTFFEYATAMALMHFRHTGADPVILETGMGGRYDATNCIQPLVSIITPLGLDHQQYLGSTIESIAHEKAGIVKQGAPLVSAVAQAEAVRILDDACRRAGVAQFRLGREFFCLPTGPDMFDYSGMDLALESLRPSLRGLYQAGNAALAAAAAEVLREGDFSITADAIRDGISTAKWPGRFDLVSQNPAILLDGAHNAPAWECLAGSLAALYPGKEIVIVAGIMRDKDIGAFLRCFTPMCRAIVFCRPDVARAADRRILAKFVRFSDENRILWAPDPHDALRRARELVSPDGLICVTGSLYLVGSLYHEFHPSAGGETSGVIAL